MYSFGIFLVTYEIVFFGTLLLLWTNAEEEDSDVSFMMLSLD